MSGAALPTNEAGWLAFFAGFQTVVLVANSDAVDASELAAGFGADRTLYVFFNKTYKVLQTRFEPPSLLVARSSEAGANIVYRREVDVAVRPLEGASFAGIANLRCAPRERFSPVEAFGGRAVGHLDLAGRFDGFYPSGRIPSSGFALAVWLAEQRMPIRICLAGFSARRSERWKLFAVHDWTFEQTLLRLLLRAGRLHPTDRSIDAASFAAIAKRFPEFSADDVATTLGELLSERLANTDAAVDRLFSLTRFQAKLQEALRRMKPRTRKQRLAEGRDGGDRRDGLAKTGGGD